MHSKIKKSWGGKWTEKKLDAFEKYVKAYLTIMNKYRDVYRWKLVYFDGFAGSGTRNQEEEKEEAIQMADLFGQEVTLEDINVYEGAAERVVKIESDGIRSFDQYYFVDNDEASCRALEEKLAQYHISGRKDHLKSDANDAVKKLANDLLSNKNNKSLVLLDPFGMQINWETIESLRDLSVDLWILVPTGVIINRLLERKIDKHKGLIHAEKLKSFFGMTEKEILDYFYTAKQEHTFFGDEHFFSKEENAIRKIVELYVNRLKGVFPFVTEKPMILLNNHNVPIYHLVFASKNKTALKIAQSIIDKQ